MTSNFASQIMFLFRSPSDAPKENEVGFSNLYLLRREICTCLGSNPNDFCTSADKGYLTLEYQVLWPGVMAIMAGIDLLAKFAYGDAPNEVGKRFKKFVKEYICAEMENELYQLRNSLLHSFGLYSESRGNIYRFVLGARIDENHLMQQQGRYFYLNILQLHKLFEECIPILKDAILNGQIPAEQFENMLNKYGYIRIGPKQSFI